MEKNINIDISENEGNIYISEENSSGAIYPIDFSKDKKQIIKDIEKAFSTYIINYVFNDLTYEINKKDEDYEKE